MKAIWQNQFIVEWIAFDCSQPFISWCDLIGWIYLNVLAIHIINGTSKESRASGIKVTAGMFIQPIDLFISAPWRAYLECHLHAGGRNLGNPISPLLYFVMHHYSLYIWIMHMFIMSLSPRGFLMQCCKGHYQNRGTSTLLSLYKWFILVMDERGILAPSRPGDKCLYRSLPSSQLNQASHLEITTPWSGDEFWII